MAIENMQNLLDRIEGLENEVRSLRNEAVKVLPPTLTSGVVSRGFDSVREQLELVRGHVVNTAFEHGDLDWVTRAIHSLS